MHFFRIINVIMAGLLLWAGAGPLAAEPVRVTVSTALIEGVAASIGGERVILVPVIPYAMCPGHFDLSPRKAAGIASSDLFLQHGFEAFARGLNFAGGGPERVVLQVAGNAMIPDVHRKLAEAVMEALCEVAPADADWFRLRAAEYLKLVQEAELDLQKQRDFLEGTPVLAAAMIAPFVEWTGCLVKGVFARDEAVSARELVELIRKGRRSGIRLVVENQQSMGRTGRRLAKELGVPLVILSNFPPPMPNAYPEALKEALNDLKADL